MALKAIRRKRRQAERRGHVAEYLAALYLIAKGYRILSLRYRTALGEIDIIAKRGRVIAFIEVKSRADHGMAINAVTYQSQQRICAASQLWISRHLHSADYSARYDIVALCPYKMPQHVINAF